ncbi:hypothetical protein YC2023_028137 [Brassica napus]
MSKSMVNLNHKYIIKTNATLNGWHEGKLMILLDVYATKKATSLRKNGLKALK